MNKPSSVKNAADLLFIPPRIVRSRTVFGDEGGKKCGH
jgi:hypothetical protein